jgi:hypothetical protein
MMRRITSAWAAAACLATVVTLQSSVAASQQKADQKIAPTKAATKSIPQATLTGCLQAHGSKYVLTDLQGYVGPTSRSWKTGFIKKSQKDIEVVSESSTLKLKDHVGHQITVTGVQDHPVRVKARSIKQLAPSCS